MRKRIIMMHLCMCDRCYFEKVFIDQTKEITSRLNANTHQEYKPIILNIQNRQTGSWRIIFFGIGTEVAIIFQVGGGVEEFEL
ncbi:hypothetical protein [Desulfosporosinus sp. I2]|uniref:hypothetical protein n=1 Tax=Desulfosporosinus sp. I2 TaxID=1617025 RepID=UPI000A69A1DD|nr:hypothetical protein [Desulfosporosinus sp. I2]